MDGNNIIAQNVDKHTTNSSWFNRGKGQLSILHSLGMYTDYDNYVCPLCLKSFDEGKVSELTKEDAPQASLGGKKIALTCKECNNGLGTLIDCHLSNYIERIENGEFLIGMNAPIEAASVDSRVNVRGTIKVTPEGMKLIVSKKNNNPKILQSELDGWREDSVLNVSIADNPNKRLPNNIVAALFKDAYIILFSYLGYTFALDPHYDKLREQLFNPGERIIPDGLFHFGTRFVPDGVYAVSTEDCRGFFVQFSLKKIKEHPCAVFIPAPSVTWEQASERMKAIKAGDAMMMMLLGYVDAYFNDLAHIQRVIKWLNSHTMPWQ